MDETLGNLYFDMRARLQLWRQDLATADREFSALRAKMETPININAGGGGRGGGGGSGLSGATAAAVASTSGGGMGPNVTGTSNGDVTWNLRQAVRDTGARYGSSGRGRGGNYDIDDPKFPATDEEKQMDRLVRAAAKSRDEFGGRGLSEPVTRGTSESVESGGGRGGRASSSSMAGVRHLIRGTIAGLIVDAVAGELSNEANYRKGMALAGNDANAQAAATIGRERGMLSSVPLVGGILGNLYDASGGAATSTQIELNQRQASYQDNQFSRGISARLADQRRGTISAGPNSVTAALRGIGEQRTALVAGFSDSNKTALDAYSLSHPVQGLSLPSLIYENQTREEAIAKNAVRDTGMLDLSRTLTAQNQRRLGPLDQSAAETLRTGRYNLNLSLADLARQQRQNQFRPAQGEAEYGVSQGQSISDYYSGGRGNISSLDRESAQVAMSSIREGFIGKQREVIDNLRWGTAMQYNPMIESPLQWTDRSVESQGDVLSANTEAIKKLTEIITNFTTAGNSN